MTATALKVNGYLLMPEIAAPSTPASNTVAEYPKSDGHLYQKDDTGTETDLAQAGSVGTAVAPYAVTIGDGSTTAFTITHNLGTKDVLVHVYSLTSPYPTYVMSPEHTTTNTLTLTFSSAPAINSVRVVVAAYAGVSLTDVSVNKLTTDRTANLSPNGSATVDTSGWSASNATLSRDTGTFRSSPASFKLTTTGTGGGSLISDALPCAKGDATRIDGYIRGGTGTDGDAFSVSVTFFDDGMSSLGSSTIWTGTMLAASWRTLNEDRSESSGAYAPDEAAFFRITIAKTTAGSASDTWFVDDIDIFLDGVLVTNNIAFSDRQTELRIGDKTEASSGRIIIENSGSMVEVGTSAIIVDASDVSLAASDDITLTATDDLNLNFGNLFANGTEIDLVAIATRRELRLRRAAVQNIASGTLTDISWDTEDTDTHGFIAVTGTTITIPAGFDGVWGITFTVNIAGGSITARNLIDIRTTSSITGVTQIHRSSLYGDDRGTCTVITRLDAGDTITCPVQQSSGTARDYTAWLQLAMLFAVT